MDSANPAMITHPLARIHYRGMWEQTRANWNAGLGLTRPSRLGEYTEDVYRYAFARLGSREDAEDVTMEVMVAASQDPRLAKNRLLMLHNARNRVIDRLRKRRDSAEISDEVAVPATDVHLVLAVNQVLSLLDDDQADALVLKYVHGLSAQEIAKATGKSRAAVNSSLQRARERFRNLAPELCPTTRRRHEP